MTTTDNSSMSLAINGGRPVRVEPWPDWPVPLGNELDYLTEVLNSRRWTPRGPYNGHLPMEARFGREFASFIGSRFAVPTSSGSAALTIALEALDVGFGDEVVVPALGWPAAAIAAANVNARVRFADVDPATMCVSVDTVRPLVTPQTKAIVVIHLHGIAADMEAFVRFREETGIAIIEDCAQSIGTRIGQQMAGTFGDIGVFSMNQEKVLPAGEGGVAVTDSPELDRRLQQLRADGSIVGLGRGEVYRYDAIESFEVMAANYALSEFGAAVARAQLEHLPALTDRRAAASARLSDLLRSVQGVEPLAVPDWVSRPSPFEFVLKIDTSEFGAPLTVIAQALTAELGLWFHTIDPPLPQNAMYRPEGKRRHVASTAETAPTDCPHAEAAVGDTLVFHHRGLLADVVAIDHIREAIVKVRAGLALP